MWCYGRKKSENVAVTKKSKPGALGMSHQCSITELQQLDNHPVITILESKIHNSSLKYLITSLSSSDKWWGRHECIFVGHELKDGWMWESYILFQLKRVLSADKINAYGSIVVVHVYYLHVLAYLALYRSRPNMNRCIVQVNSHMWQSRVEIEHYSVAYFARIAAFRSALAWSFR